MIVPLAGLLLVACEQQAEDPAPAGPPTETPAKPALPQPPALPALDREDLIRAAAQAASFYAADRIPPGTDPLVGQNFAVRIAFGCAGPTQENAGAVPANGLAASSWSRNRENVQISMAPADWAELPLVTQAGGSEAWEAVEGYWVPNPWLNSESCPAIAGNTGQEGAQGASPQTVGIAAVFETGGSRIGRRNGRAYRITVSAEDTAPERGYRLLLEGRITAFPDGRAIACRAAGPRQRPVCIVATKLDRVAFEEPGGKTLSEW